MEVAKVYSHLSGFLSQKNDERIKWGGIMSKSKVKLFSSFYSSFSIAYKTQTDILPLHSYLWGNQVSIISYHAVLMRRSPHLRFHHLEEGDDSEKLKWNLYLA